MSITAAVAATVVLAAISVVQLLAAAGLPMGRMLWGGQHRVLPRRLRIGSVLSILLYAGFVWILLTRARGEPTAFIEVATWVLFAYFAFGIVLNALSRSRQERAVMTPACAVLALSAFVIAIS
jgi:hypothetical protein